MAHVEAALGALAVVAVVVAVVVAHEVTSVGSGGEAESSSDTLERVGRVGEVSGGAGLGRVEADTSGDDASLSVEKLHGVTDSAGGFAGAPCHAPGSVEDGDLAVWVGEEGGGGLVHGFSGGGASSEACSSRCRSVEVTSTVRQGSARGFRW